MVAVKNNVGFVFVAVIPNWSQSVKRLKKKSHRGSPILLLVSCAATRIVELNR